jgi:hypothetical protein
VVAGRALLVWGVLLAGTGAGCTEPSPGHEAEPPTSSVWSMVPRTSLLAGGSTARETPTRGGSGVGDVPLTLEQVSAARADALSHLEGVRATRWPDVVMAMPDGRVWVSMAGGSFESFDPSSGVYRSLRRGELGAVSAQEIIVAAGDLDAAHLAWGRPDPFAPVAADSPGIVPEVVEITREGHASWQVSWSEDGESERAVVDVATGLVVERVGGDGVWSLSDVRPIDSLPSEFPGSFPGEVEATRVAHWFAQRATSVSQAADGFTAGLIVPSTLRDRATVFVYDSTLAEGGDTDPRREVVTMFLRDGFDITRVVVSKFLPYDDVTIRSGEVDCYDVDHDDTCDFQEHRAGTVSDGALAGRDYTVSHGDVTVYDAGRTVEITSVDPQHSLRVANTFVPA